jgi:hypothetical protein
LLSDVNTRRLRQVIQQQKGLKNEQK